MNTVNSFVHANNEALENRIPPHMIFFHFQTYIVFVDDVKNRIKTVSKSRPKTVSEINTEGSTEQMYASNIKSRQIY